MAALRTTTLAAALLAMLTAARHPPAPPPEPAPVAAAPTIKAGVEKWRAGDYAAAVAIWQPFAAAGDADALFNLGQAYKLGRGVDADPAMARDYYRKAAIKGHLPAQANLGIALFQAGEKPEAVKWLKTAADRGEARAQYVLGIAAFNGDGIPRSQSLGYGYLLRAQASGLPQAAAALGSITPGLSSGDRTAGEAIAASLAAGSGVPAALVTASAPRLIPGTLPSRPTASLPPSLPIVTRPTAAAPSSSLPSSLPSSAIAASPPAVRPPLTVATTALSGTPPVRMTTPLASRQVTLATAEPVAKPAAAGPPADRPVLPPVPKPVPAVPLREPTPAQADAAAAVLPRPTVATVDVAPSRPPEPTKPVDPLTAPPPRLAARPAMPPRSFEAAPPLRPFEVAADAPAKKPDGWRVQLGAFSSRKLADAAWADVKTTAAPARPVFATDGPVTKLQMGPFATRDAAKAACTKLTAAGRACFVTQG